MNLVTVAQNACQIDQRLVCQIRESASSGDGVGHAAAKGQYMQRFGLMDSAANIDPNWRGRRCGQGRCGWNWRMDDDGCWFGTRQQQQRSARSDKDKGGKK